jgi:hypothetical protein
MPKSRTIVPLSGACFMQTNSNQEKVNRHQKNGVVRKTRRNSFAIMARNRKIRDLALLDAALRVWDAKRNLQLMGRVS